MASMYERDTTVDGATSGAEASTSSSILIAVDRTGRTPLVDQVAEGIRRLIDNGGLSAGRALPSTRQLARDLGVSRGVVVSAYEQLRHEGRLQTRQGSATTVAQLHAPAPSPSPRSGWTRDLHPEVTDLSAFPRVAWSRAFGRALASLPNRDLGYHNTDGLPELKAELAGYLARTRHVRVDADEVIVCTGLLQSLHISLELLSHLDGAPPRLALSRINHPAVATVMASTGATPEWMDIDDDGVVPPPPHGTPSRAVLLNPHHQYPLGAATSRDRLDDLTTRHGLIIEDTSNADLTHTGLGAPALQGRDPERVVLIGSVSRALAPALRIGWIVAPRHLRPTASEMVRRRGLSPSSVEQATLAELISTGGLDHHLRHRRTEYRRRAAALRAVLEERAPHLRALIPTAGFHAVVFLPHGCDEARTVDNLAHRGIRVFGMGTHVLHGEPPQTGIVFGYATLPIGSMGAFTDALVDAVQQAGGRAGP